MGRLLKKFQKGSATTYISRTKALKKLRLSLKDFRRLCIIKGIYPHEPHHPKKVNKGSTAVNTWYFAKDIAFLQHEPIISAFRQYKVYLRKLKKAITLRQRDTEQKLREARPLYRVDHIVKERYPSFIDALRDLEDPLCMCFLFAKMPKTHRVNEDMTHLCRRLTVEFMHYIISQKALRKVFISIKGIYYQVEIMGQKITWIVPHERRISVVNDVDFSIMSSFLEFYCTLLGFVNFRLYLEIGLHYPPQLCSANEKDTKSYSTDDEAYMERINVLTQSLVRMYDPNADGDDVKIDEFKPEPGDAGPMEKALEEQKKVERLQKLFSNCKFFLNREVPHESVTFVIRSCGGQVSWDESTDYGSTYQEDDPTITHQIVDRPKVTKKYLTRIYIQPQWVYDCVNNALLLPPQDYFPECRLPPHLSPFVEESETDYIPEEKVKLLKLQGRNVINLPKLENARSLLNDPSSASTSKKRKKEKKPLTELGKRPVSNEADVKPDSVADMQVKPGVVKRLNAHQQIEAMAEEKKLQEMMIAKKYKRLYRKLKYDQKEKRKEFNNLLRKKYALKSGVLTDNAGKRIN
ncbi:unnamed protein product [Soboliphyme baturini]|uniref:Pescadillo homolog n=1 Tax=Soboliphyme baturini TaxID=241478 RepID=A0A183IFY2_9BILA|nr:unnamed protein product [Soboliphyme baturini]